MEPTVNFAVGGDGGSTVPVIVNVAFDDASTMVTERKINEIRITSNMGANRGLIAPLYPAT